MWPGQWPLKVSLHPPPSGVDQNYSWWSFTPLSENTCSLNESPFQTHRDSFHLLCQHVVKLRRYTSISQLSLNDGTWGLTSCLSFFYVFSVNHCCLKWPSLALGNIPAHCGNYCFSWLIPRDSEHTYAHAHAWTHTHSQKSQTVTRGWLWMLHEKWCGQSADFLKPFWLLWHLILGHKAGGMGSRAPGSIGRCRVLWDVKGLAFSSNVTLFFFLSYGGTLSLRSNRQAALVKHALPRTSSSNRHKDQNYVSLPPVLPPGGLESRSQRQVSLIPKERNGKQHKKFRTSHWCWHVCVLVCVCCSRIRDTWYAFLLCLDGKVTPNGAICQWDEDMFQKEQK